MQLEATKKHQKPKGNHREPIKIYQKHKNKAINQLRDIRILLKHN